MKRNNPKRAEVMEQINFGARLYRIRTRCGLRQDEVAMRMKTSPAQISQWERGGIEPGISAVVCLAQIFGLTVGQMVGTEPITKEDDFRLCMRF